MVAFLDEMLACTMLMLALQTCLHTNTWRVSGQICNTPGWRDFGDSQYLIVNSGQSWNNAKVNCQLLGGDLAVITSHEQTDFLVTYTFKNANEWNYWIGLHDPDGDGQYTWISNTQSGYSNWHNLQPSSVRQCVLMRSTHSVEDQGKWQTSDCSISRVFICQRPIDHRCSWHRFGQSLYRYYGEAKSFYNARTSCTGGDLAITKSTELHSFLVAFISPPIGQRTCYWIGLIDPEKDNTYTWVDGTPLRSNESFWVNKEPNYWFENCACMNSFMSASNPGHGRWYDVKCAEGSRPYICERVQVMSEEWTNYPNVQYYMPSFSANYFDAVEYCNQIGGTLAQLKTSEIDKNITNSFSADGVTSFWIGLDALRKESVFQWADGTLLRNSRFNMWIPDKPDNFQGYQFCVTRRTGPNGGWDDQFCNETHRFVCEKSKGCPPGKWNVPVCDRLCDNCYNGGVCNYQTGTCICPPGFSGKNCLKTCGDQRFGPECEHLCRPAGMENPSCSENRICFSDSTECSCLAGYEGVFCNETCPGGKFGSMCLQDCHCIDGIPCDKFTGKCEGGCENGWSGEGCQVPSVCPTGYFGVNCIDHCNCPGNGGCDKDSGFCTSSGGRCEIGFTPDSVDMPDSCNSFTGCFSLCSSTCHCKDGEDDCNLDTGSCSSGGCHPRWRGDNCTIDRFQSTREKTNPGVAIFSCSVTFDSPTNVSSDHVKAAIGDFSIDKWKMPHGPPRKIPPTILNFTFYIQDIPDDSPIYCFIGDPRNKSEFGYVKLTSAAFYELPSLKTRPTLVAFGHHWVVISWKVWNSSSDRGEGPITGYRVYLQTADVNDTHGSIILPDGSFENGSVRNRRDVTSEDMDSLEHNITELEAGTNYEIEIAVIREGPKGEGVRGPALRVMTKELIANGGGSVAVGHIAGGAVGGLLVILCLVTIILLLRRKRNLHENVGKGSAPPESAHNDYISQGQVEADEEIGSSVPLPSAQSTSRIRPAVPPKRLTLAAPQLESVDGENAEVPSVSSLEGCTKDRHPIPLSDFPAFVQKNRHSNFFQEEFKDLPEANIYPQTVAKKGINFEKNRYKNILPYDSARVKLAIRNNDPDTDYFNASFIPSLQHPQRYIASQGPNNASMEDFWRMVWQENVATIAMVTNLSEANKIKCRQYWPETSTIPLLFGDITVELESVQRCSGGSMRSLVLRKGKETRFLNQFHYTEWPDRDVPRNMSSLLNFISEVQKDHGQNNSPLLIHCSAGVGRTGVVITIDSVVAEAKRNKLVDIFGFVSKIRQNRPYMVQTKEQYKFVYEAVLESLLSENTDIPANYFSSRLAKLRGVDHYNTAGRTGLSIQFENIKILCPDPPASMIRTGTTTVNRPKSRYGNSLPTQMNRVILQSVNTECSDFINASFVKGNHGRFITTQMPMPNTVADFWVMILDYKPSAIIMLNDDIHRDKSCARYWLDDGMATFGYLSVLTLSTTQREGFIKRTLEVSRGNSKVRHEVEQYQFLDWPADVAKERKYARSILRLVEEVREAYTAQHGSPLVVHCLSGVGRTSVFCSVLECIAQILDEEVVNVFQTVKMMRRERMHFVQTEEEYSFIHVLIDEYLQSNDYEQLPCGDDQEHTYGNMECAARPAKGESVYEVTDLRGGATAYPPHTVSAGEEPNQEHTKAPERETVYENFGYER